jgi:methylase of polypeptide subunit release factors
MTSAVPDLARASVTDAMPLRLGTAEDFARVRRFLYETKFHETKHRADVKAEDMSGAPASMLHNIEFSTNSPALQALIEIFVNGNAVAADEFRAICGDDTFAAFEALNLIRQAKQQDGTIVSPVWLYGVDDVVIASDRQNDADGGRYEVPEEIVFPALDVGTLKFLRFLPSVAGDALDLCGGTGIGAMHFARTARRATTVDLTRRAEFFAEFNARLNGIDIEILRGDLFAPVADRRFDAISAHPPWMPSTGDGAVFRDGGDLGDALIRRMVEEIPDHLTVGGTAVILAMGRDTTEAPYEQLVRQWLGPKGYDCDVIFGVDWVNSIEDVVASMRKLHLKGEAEAAERIAERLRSAGTERFTYGAMFIRRTGRPVAEPPLRLRTTPRTTAADFDRLFAWRMHCRSAGFAEWLKNATPSLAPYLEINVRYFVKQGTSIPDTVIFKVENGFSMGLKPDGWTLPLITSFDGRRTVAQAFEMARMAKQTPDEFPLSAFLGLVGVAIEQGLLTVDVPAPPWAS